VEIGLVEVALSSGDAKSKEPLAVGETFLSVGEDA
jgi:hypothetical protein